MGNFFGMFDNEDTKIKKEEDKEKNVDDKKLRLHQEELDISKNRVKTGDVEISKEIIEEQKIIDVPVIHEEVVIERRAISNETSDAPITAEESIHIPVSEERVEVGRHTVVTGEISASKREVEGTQQIKETLKREEARVHTDGDPKIVNDQMENQQH